MPKLLLAILLCSLFLIYYPTPTQANTDPIAATVSATARVPSSAPTTSDTLAPPSVTLITPFDGAVTNQSRPEFSWIQTFDANSNIVTYTLYLNGVATYLGVSNTGNSQQSNYVAHLGDGRVYLAPTLDLPEGSYNWYVRATDGANNSSYSATWHFTIDQTAPILDLTDIDQKYSYPTLTEGSIFDLTGPQTVTLTYQTERYATITLTYTLPDGTTYSHAYPSDNLGLVVIDLDLPLGTTSLVTSSFDQAGLTTTLPLYYLNLTPTKFAGLLTSLNLPPLVSSPDSISAIPSLPATIMQLAYSTNIALFLMLLLAVAIAILLIFIWYRTPNILILDSKTNKPYRSIILYHSRPNHSASFKNLVGKLYITTHEPILYSLGSRGSTYIKSLGRFSRLTIRTPDGMTYVMSLCASRRKYIISI